MSDRSELFCSKPFDWLDVSIYPRRGSSYLCCPTWLPRSVGGLGVGGLGESSADELWNGERAQDIRRSIHDGSFRYCTKSCPFLRSATGPVQKKSEVSDGRLRQIIDEARTVLEDGPTVVNAAFDRSCNLSCPSCRTEKIIEKKSADEILTLQEELERRVLPGARILYITGSGDAFGSPYFNRWLRKLDPAKLPALEAIHLHTNGLLWTKKMWEQIPEPMRALIKSCEISIDAASAETYAENRRGGHFETLLENAAFIKGLRKSGQLGYVKIHMVVQANNLREMPAFVVLGDRFGADRIYFSRLDQWGSYPKQEYLRRAVHRKEHPEHGALLAVLEDPSLAEQHVDLGNLRGLGGTLAPVRPVEGLGELIERYIG